MAATITTFNYLLNVEHQAFYGGVNGGTAYDLCLFTAGGPLNPGKVWTDLTQAAYPGYAPLALANKWTPQVKVVDGLYQVGSAALTFAAPSSGATVNITGYVVKEHASNNMIFGDDFSPPVALAVGGAGLTFSIQFDRWSRSILPF